MLYKIQQINNRVIYALLILAFPISAISFSYIFVNNGVDIVTHPTGYVGGGGILNVTVGIDPTSVNAADMVIPTQNVIEVINDLMETNDNLQSANVPFTEWDFESVLLHEVGHSIGLGHVNLGAQGSLTSAQREYTNSFTGSNGSFDLDDGVDNVTGSSDDVRGDDVNIHWFRISNNDPFTLANTVDNTTYSRDIADLPAGHLFPANGSRDVSNLLGYGNDTESIMQQGSPNGEAQRTLTHDDVAGILFAQSGLDETQSTGDDYTLNLVYSGLTATADIVIDFDAAQTGFAVSQSGGAFIGGSGHIRITSNSIYFHPTVVPWFFNDQSLLPVELVEFKVEKREEDALIRWVTATEIEHNYYEIQRKVDNGKWENIHRIYGEEGNFYTSKKYEFVDENYGIYGKFLEYRLKMVSIVGEEEYSNVRVLESSDFYQNRIHILGNPASGNSILELNLEKEQRVVLRLLDMSGRVLTYKKLNGEEGIQQFEIGDLMDVAPGIYFVQVELERHRETVKMVKM